MRGAELHSAAEFHSHALQDQWRFCLCCCMSCSRWQQRVQAGYFQLAFESHLCIVLSFNKSNHSSSMLGTAAACACAHVPISAVQGGLQLLQIVHVPQLMLMLLVPVLMMCP
jgi:hypothetical protein